MLRLASLQARKHKTSHLILRRNPKIKILFQVQKTLERIQASKKLLNNIDTLDGFDSHDAIASTKIIKKRLVKVS